MKTKLHFSKRYLIGLFVIFVLFLFGSRPVYTHVTMQYAQDPTGDAYTAVYDEEDKLAESEVEHGISEMFFWGSEFTKITPIHYDSHEELHLTNLEIRVHGFLVVDLNPGDMLDYLTPNEDFEYVKVTDKGLEIKTEDDFPAFEATKLLLDKTEQVTLLASLLTFVFYGMLYSLMYWYLFVVLDIRKDHSYLNILDAVLGVVGIMAMLLVFAIAFKSPYGVTVHPDEMQTRAAIEYYRTHWMQPDVRSEFVAGTVSGYGMTRLSEINLYYLFAGKFANLCVFEMSFRALGMLMMAVLTCFVLKNIKQERFVAVLFFATPQLWYLFSYATSDAYDYLFTAFATYQLLASKSMLNKILKEPFSKRHLPAYLVVGFIFANLLMAKKSFYVMLLTSFMILLYRMLFAGKGNKRKYFAKYMGILVVAFAVVLIRYAPDFGYYGLGKSAAVEQVIEETAWTEYKPSTPAHLQAASTLLYEKGVTLKEFFTEWEFNKELFKNYFGYYGVYSLEAEEWYYFLMGAVYMALFVSVGVLYHKRVNAQTVGQRAVLQARLIYWTMWAMMGVMYLLTIYNAYFVDFQPQGRYLFPALPALACQMSIYEETEEHPVVRTLLVAIAVISLYSFYKIAYLNF